MKQKRSCSNCIKGNSIPVNDDIFCLLKGAVTPDFVCSQHKFAPLTKAAIKDMKPGCIECIHFILKPDNPPELYGLGTCRLFSVRLFDGSQKKACSRFEANKAASVS